MEISSDDFRRHFEVLSDEALLATNRDDLVEAAQSVYDEELAHRGLIADGASDAPEAEGEPVADADVALADAEGAVNENLVSVGSFTVMEEARMARGLLQVAGIPSGLANEKTALGALHLMVPASLEEAALQVLAGEISEEDLAAQAEAAGFADSEEYEAEEEPSES